MSEACAMRFSGSRTRALAGSNASPTFGNYSGDSASARRRTVRIRGAFHVHSTLSRDGTMTISDLVQWYMRNGYQFLAMGEHAEDLDEAKLRELKNHSIENSNDRFCVVPGIEFAGNGDIHILGVGVVQLIP